MHFPYKFFLAPYITERTFNSIFLKLLTFSLFYSECMRATKKFLLILWRDPAGNNAATRRSLAHALGALEKTISDSIFGEKSTSPLLNAVIDLSFWGPM